MIFMSVGMWICDTAPGALEASLRLSLIEPTNGARERLSLNPHPSQVFLISPWCSSNSSSLSHLQYPIYDPTTPRLTGTLSIDLKYATHAVQSAFCDLASRRQTILLQGFDDCFSHASKVETHWAFQDPFWQ